MTPAWLCMRRYGPNSGAFLLPLYGGGELPQAFCRVAAVAGALYVLRAPVQALLLGEQGRVCRGVRTAAGQVGIRSARTSMHSCIPAYMHLIH